MSADPIPTEKPLWYCWCSSNRWGSQRLFGLSPLISWSWRPFASKCCIVWLRYLRYIINIYDWCLRFLFVFSSLKLRFKCQIIFFLYRLLDLGLFFLIDFLASRWPLGSRSLTSRFIKLNVVYFVELVEYRVTTLLKFNALHLFLYVSYRISLSLYHFLLSLSGFSLRRIVHFEQVEHILYLLGLLNNASWCCYAPDTLYNIFTIHHLHYLLPCFLGDIPWWFIRSFLLLNLLKPLIYGPDIVIHILKFRCLWTTFTF